MKSHKGKVRFHFTPILIRFPLSFLPSLLLYLFPSVFSTLSLCLSVSFRYCHCSPASTRATRSHTLTSSWRIFYPAYGSTATCSLTFIACVETEGKGEEKGRRRNRREEGRKKIREEGKGRGRRVHVDEEEKEVVVEGGETVGAADGSNFLFFLFWG